MDLIIYSFLLYGTSNIVVYGTIFEPFRQALTFLQKIPLIKYLARFIDAMTSCMMCFPTWLGFLLGYFIYSPTQIYLIEDDFKLYFILDGFIASGITWSIHSIITYFEE